MEIKISGKIEPRKITKWLIGVVTACILIYLAVRHLDMIASGVVWLGNLTLPLWVGIIMALVLNVPMRPIERGLRFKRERAKRPVAILLSLGLVLGIFIGVAFLVAPEIANTIRLVAQAVMSGLDQAASWEQTIDFSAIPFGAYLEQIDVDWIEIKQGLEQWTVSQRTVLLRQAAETASSVAGVLMNFLLGLVFSVYILANQETLKKQTLRLLRVWLPQKLGAALVHIVSVCNRSFWNFIAGQAVEAVILGTLCTVGMLVLRLPYAPMIGALVGVTALVPIVGAFLGTIVGAFLILTVSPFQALFAVARSA